MLLYSTSYNYHYTSYLYKYISRNVNTKEVEEYIAVASDNQSMNTNEILRDKVT
jgi:hypothetical protein